MTHRERKRVRVRVRTPEPAFDVGQFYGYKDDPPNWTAIGLSIVFVVALVAVILRVA